MAPRIRVELTYPVDLAHYPDGVTTIADAFRFDVSKVADNSINAIELLAFAFDEDITITVVDDVQDGGGAGRAVIR